MTTPVFLENLKLIFPEIDTVPHQDTINRLLSNIDVSQLEKAPVELIQEFMCKKKFARYLTNGIITKTSHHAWVPSHPIN